MKKKIILVNSEAYSLDDLCSVIVAHTPTVSGYESVTNREIRFTFREVKNPTKFKFTNNFVSSGLFSHSSATSTTTGHYGDVYATPSIRVSNEINTDKLSEYHVSILEEILDFAESKDERILDINRIYSELVA